MHQVDEIVQEIIASTNGVHYVDRVRTLDSYPAYELPVNPAKGNSLMLDIGCGWGRWLVAGGKKNYIPIGIDVIGSFASASRRVMAAHGTRGYTVNADLQDIPFKSNCFDLIWSFSVIQHVHKKRLSSCLNHIHRILAGSGKAKLEFPNLDGLRNRRGPVKQEMPYWDDFDHLCVRYYSISDYKRFFLSAFDNFSYSIHSFLGIGVLKEDLKYVSPKNKMKVAGSLLLTELSKVVPGMKSLADSIYIKVEKKEPGVNNDVLAFLELHAKSNDNLNIVKLLQCPITGTSLRISDDRTQLISEGGYMYPIENDIPIMMRKRAVKFKESSRVIAIPD